MSVSRFRWSSYAEQDCFPVYDPSTGHVIAQVQGCDATGVDGAVKAAHRAFNVDWRWRTGRERGAILSEAARRLRGVGDQIAALEVSENGKPLLQAKADVESCITSFDYFGGLAGKLPGDFFDGGAVYGSTLLEPYGVVAAIVPYNWPPIHTGGKIAPALAVGNTVVLKPAEQTPLTIMKIVEVLESVLPPDIVHAVPGLGATGATLVSHNLVSKVSFTGSPTTGAAVLKSCADNHTPALMELGGKNAIIVLEGADVSSACRAALEAGFFNQGQACTAGSRLLVHRSLYDEVASRLSDAVSRLNVGAGSEPATHVGPLTTKQQQRKVLEYLRIGEAEGATVAARAEMPSDPRLRDGFYVAPTLLTGVTARMRVAREEIFGPVVCMIGFDTFEEAMNIANDTDFGLTAAVFGPDQASAMAAARRLDVGMVFINNYYRGIQGMPFGGTKASGFGREHSVETLKEFGRTKLITMASGLREVPAWAAVTDVGL